MGKYILHFQVRNSHRGSGGREEGRDRDRVGEEEELSEGGKGGGGGIIICGIVLVAP